MKPLTSNRVRSRVLNDDELRRQYYESVQQARRERIAQEQREAQAAAEKENRMAALYARIGYDPDDHPALDARDMQHSDEVEITSATAQTVEDVHRFIYWRRLQKSAARRRLRDIGIKLTKAFSS